MATYLAISSGRGDGGVVGCAAESEGVGPDTCLRTRPEREGVGSVLRQRGQRRGVRAEEEVVLVRVRVRVRVSST